ncbi:hypothetical protein AVEN_239732-1 [Araneus ventricosus]|uniref:Uncharacterized protein n=1 Tax=Araneus ventricosus TaxID=182803 RepID=A0A4Y2VZ94_ARAVE|nr:hypothetical protein AVEN_236543-1 [Araneus ventricosus]GBO30775.1 hypothetical protein AVEN_239732-1 [Araneus ventricosus]
MPRAPLIPHQLVRDIQSLLTHNRNILVRWIEVHVGYRGNEEADTLAKPAGVVSPKLSRILLEKRAVSPPPAWIKKFEPIVTHDPMSIRKYLGKKSNLNRCVPIKCVPISTLS